MIQPSASHSNPACDVVIRGGQVFDGAGSPRVVADVAISDGKVQAVGPRLPQTGRQEVDAQGCWVMPGMLDIHTHYDAEIEAMPGLEESVRHGVTTVVMGNCSLSAALGTQKDILDLFCRVESLPRNVLTKWLGDELPWNGVREYYDHLEKLPVGPNVASFLGHSNVRSHVMGMERSLKESKATPDEVRTMQKLVDDALAEGYLGLSIDMLPWHRLDGRAVLRHLGPLAARARQRVSQPGRSGPPPRAGVAGHAQRADEEHGGDLGHVVHGSGSQSRCGPRSWRPWTSRPTARSTTSPRWAARF